MMEIALFILGAVCAVAVLGYVHSRRKGVSYTQGLVSALSGGPGGGPGAIDR